MSVIIDGVPVLERHIGLRVVLGTKAGGFLPESRKGLICRVVDDEISFTDSDRDIGDLADFAQDSIDRYDVTWEKRPDSRFDCDPKVPSSVYLEYEDEESYNFLLQLFDKVGITYRDRPYSSEHVAFTGSILPGINLSHVSNGVSFQGTSLRSFLEQSFPPRDLGRERADVEWLMRLATIEKSLKTISARRESFLGSIRELDAQMAELREEHQSKD